MERIDYFESTNIFISGPAEFLAEKVALAVSGVSQFRNIFGSSINHYLRDDYSIRELPAIRIYNENYSREYETWYLNGELVIDVIFPPNIRRDKTQKYQDMIVSALCQQFTRPSFLTAIEADVPGLNELGKTFSADKSLGFLVKDQTVPLTQIRANFRVLLTEWNKFLESDYRTIDDPFERTLSDLDLIQTEIAALSPSGTIETTVIFQKDLT